MPVPLIIVLVTLLAGCKQPTTLTTNDGNASPITLADVSYNKVATAYNATLLPLDQLYIRTNVDIEWFETDDGDRNYRSESGNGKFIFRRPGDTVLTVEKLGKVYLWAGSNDQRYWLFDLVDSDKKTAYVGSFAKLGLPGTRPLPLPVRPDTVPYLLGLMPLPVFSPGVEPPIVELYDGQYLIDLPGLRMLIDPATSRPTRVDLTGNAGYSVFTSKLDGRFAVDIKGVEDHRLPFICRKAEVYVAGYESRLTVEMDTAAADPSRVKDPMFDFDGLVKAHKVKPADVQDLDGG